MRPEHGEDLPSSGVFLEVVPPERLVMTDSFAEMPAAWRRRIDELRGAPADAPVLEVVWTITFEDAGGKTRMTQTSRFVSAADRDGVLAMGVVEGTAMSWERLEQLLAGMAA
jgi:uncharacterized protein YndB with AHSA1/START domain